MSRLHIAGRLVLPNAFPPISPERPLPATAVIRLCEQNLDNPGSSSLRQLRRAQSSELSTKYKSMRLPIRLRF